MLTRNSASPTLIIRGVNPDGKDIIIKLWTQFRDYVENKNNIYNYKIKGLEYEKQIYQKINEIRQEIPDAPFLHSYNIIDNLPIILKKCQTKKTKTSHTRICIKVTLGSNMP